MVAYSRKEISEYDFQQGSATGKKRGPFAASVILGGLKSLQNVFNQGKGKKSEDCRTSNLASEPQSSQRPPGGRQQYSVNASANALVTGPAHTASSSSGLGARQRASEARLAEQNRLRAQIHTQMSVGRHVAPPVSSPSASSTAHPPASAPSIWYAPSTAPAPASALGSGSAASRDVRQGQDQAMNLERRDSDVSVGQEVRVTSDERRLEKCVKGVGMQWPTGPSGRPWTRKLGLTGKIIQVDYKDLTVELDDGKGWVPIKAIVGYEKFGAGEYGSEEDDPQQSEPKELPQQPAKPTIQGPTPRSLPESPPSPTAGDPIQKPSEQASTKPPETSTSPKEVSASLQEIPSCSRGNETMAKQPGQAVGGSGCNADSAKEEDSKKRIDPEVTPEVTGLDQPKRPSKKGRRLSSESGKTPMSTPTTPTEATSAKGRFSRYSFLSFGDSDEEAALFTPPPRAKPRSKVKVKKKAPSSQQAETTAVALQEVAVVAEEPEKSLGASPLTADALQDRYGRSPSKVEPSLIMSRMSMAVAIDSDSEDSMEGTIYVSTTENEANGDGVFNSRRSSLLSDELNAKGVSQSRRSSLSETPKAEDAKDKEPSTSPADLKQEVQPLQAPRSRAARPPPRPTPAPESERRGGSLGSLLSELPSGGGGLEQSELPAGGGGLEQFELPAGGGSEEIPRPAARACSSFWSSPENSEAEESDRGSTHSNLQRSPSTLDDAVDNVPQAESDGWPEANADSSEVPRITITVQSPDGHSETMLLSSPALAISSLSSVCSGVPAGFTVGDATIMDEVSPRKDEGGGGGGKAAVSPEPVADSTAGVADATGQSAEMQDEYKFDDSSPCFGLQNGAAASPGSPRTLRDFPYMTRTSTTMTKTGTDMTDAASLMGDSEPEEAAETPAEAEESRDVLTPPVAQHVRSSTRSSRASRRSLNISPMMSRHINWRTSRVHSVCESNLLSEALQKVADKDRAMNPVRAQSGLSLLNRMKNLLERQDFDDTAGIKTIENIFFDSIPRKHVEIRSIEQVLRIDLLKRFLRKVADDFASIEATFHGTREEYVKDILDVGLNPNLCATGAYGRGAYVGTHAGVAHQYADPNEEGWRHMLVILVIVGSSVVKGREGEQCPSTALDSLVNPTQYCFVEEDRLYCSHLITYRVLKSSNRRTGGGWEDPFQRKLTCAVTKAAKLRNKGGLR